MIFGNNSLRKFITAIIILLPLVHSSTITRQKIEQIFGSKSKYFRNSINNRISRGDEARPGQFPHQVSMRLIYANFDYHISGGTIVNSWWVLTPAHLVIEFHKHPILKKQLRIVAGENKLVPYERAKQVRQGTRFVKHINYKGEDTDINQVQRDIGLIRVDKRWNFDTPYVKPIKHLTYSLPANTSCTVSGWGVQFVVKGVAAQPLYYMEEYLYGNDFCNTQVLPNISRFRYWNRWTLCAGNLDKNSGACLGDFGGALMCDNRAMGLLLSPLHYACYAKGRPNIYLDIPAWWQWIHDQMKKFDYKSKRLSSKNARAARTSKTHSLHIASNSFGIMNLMLILYSVILYYI